MEKIIRVSRQISHSNKDIKAIYGHYYPGTKTQSWVEAETNLSKFGIPKANFLASSKTTKIQF